MTLEAYLEALRSRVRARKKWRALYVAGFVLSVGLVWLLFAEVKWQMLYPIPSQAASYLLYTMFYSFSLTELDRVLAPSGSHYLLLPLAVMYWLYFFVAGLAPLFLVAARSRGGGRSCFTIRSRFWTSEN